MAYILKSARAWTDPFGIVHTGTGDNTGLYAIIDDLSINKSYKSARFDMVLYNTRAVRASGLQPLRVYHVTVNDPDFTTYFTTNKLIWTQCKDYLLAVGLNNVSDLIANDWTTDPQAEP